MKHGAGIVETWGGEAREETMIRDYYRAKTIFNNVFFKSTIQKEILLL